MVAKFSLGEAVPLPTPPSPALKVGETNAVDVRQRDIDRLGMGARVC